LSQTSSAANKARGNLAKGAAEAAGLAFHAAGDLPFQAMPQYYPQFDAVLVASLSEDFGLPAMEAAAAGRLAISLLGRFQQDRIDTIGGSSDVISSVGSVADFVGGTDEVFSLKGLKQWIADKRNDLHFDIGHLFTTSCPALARR
jgi:hypothetical protein